MLTEEEKRLLTCSWTRPPVINTPATPSRPAEPGILDPLVNRLTERIKGPTKEEAAAKGAEVGLKINRALIAVIVIGVGVLLARWLL